MAANKDALKTNVRLDGKKLAPCPFCRKAPILEMGTLQYWVSCESSTHSVSVGRRTEVAAARAWQKALEKS